MNKSRKTRYIFRKLRSRNRILGTSERPRLSVHRSLKHISAQIIDDLQQKTLVSATSTKKGLKKGSGIEVAKSIGAEIGKMATGKGITKVVFDRGGWPYHGRIKALADAVREAGVKF